MLVSFEGIDGVGKTTLSQELAAMTREAGVDVLLVQEFPEDFLDGYMQSLLRRDPYLRLNATHNAVIAQTLLLLTAHAYKYETLVRPALGRGATVIVDRYIDSVFAYQLPLLTAAGKDEHDAAKWIENSSVMLPPPDFTVYVEASAAQTRKWRSLRGDDLSAEDPTFLNSAALAYEECLALQNRNVIRYWNDKPPSEGAMLILKEIQHSGLR
jgi:dTMP kinase